MTQSETPRETPSQPDASPTGGRFAWLNRFLSLSSRKKQMIFGGAALLVAAGAAAVATHPGNPADSVGALQKQQVEAIVHDYILDHPEIIPQAVQKLQTRRIADLVDSVRPQLEKPFAGAWEGAANGDVVLVEFFDYACGYCRASLPDLAKLVASDAKLKIVYRELPILSDESGDAAKVSLYAAEQGKYMPYHKALYAAGQVTRETILAAAAKAGLDRKGVEGAMASATYGQEVEANIRLAQQLQATGTPLFVVGKQVLNGAVGYDALKDAVDKARME